MYLAFDEFKKIISNLRVKITISIPVGKPIAQVESIIIH